MYLPDFLPSMLSNVHGYLDPGSGSMILQVILAAFLVFAVLIRTQWSKIKALFRRKDDAPKEEDEE
jgi:hypothetical protein